VVDETRSQELLVDVILPAHDEKMDKMCLKSEGFQVDDAKVAKLMRKLA